MGGVHGPSSLEARIHTRHDAGAYAEFGLWFDENHQNECAAQAYQSGLKVMPNSDRLDYLLGSSLYAPSRFVDAIAALKVAVRLNPQELQVHLLLGAALAKLGRNQEAASEWTSALKIDPNSLAALDGQAKSLIAVGDYASVIRNLRSLTRDDNLTLDLAIAYRDAGMLDETERTLKQGLEADPRLRRFDRGSGLSVLPNELCGRDRDVGKDSPSETGRSGSAADLSPEPGDAWRQRSPCLSGANCWRRPRMMPIC